MFVKTYVCLSKLPLFCENLRCLSKISIDLDSDPSSLNNSVTLSIPIKVWRMITEGWIESDWFKDKDRDNSEVKFCIDKLNEMLLKNV